MERVEVIAGHKSYTVMGNDQYCSSLIFQSKTFHVVNGSLYRHTLQ